MHHDFVRFFLLRPNSQAFTFSAKRKEQDVSSLESPSGLTLTNISVFPSPPKHGANKYVNFELRYGMCFALLASAANTSPSEDRLLLIEHASFNRSPLAPDRETLSLPAKSTRFNTPSIFKPLEACSPETCKMKTVCDRDEWAFICVASTLRAAAALRTNTFACSTDSTSSLVTPEIVVDPFSWIILCVISAE